METIIEKKDRIRERMQSQIYRLSVSECLHADRRITAALSTWNVLARASSIVAYSGLVDEPNITRTIRSRLALGVSVALPRYSERLGIYELALLQDVDSDLVLGHYDIAEPRPDLPLMPLGQRESPDTVWLVPGLAFDQTGTRLGRGAGYYDRMLVGARGVKTGVAHQRRMLKELPCEEHDVRMNWLVSEENIIKCTHGA